MPSASSTSRAADNLEEHHRTTTALGVNLEALAASAAGREGVVWSLEAASDLNANLVRFGVGRGVGEHVNDELDVVFLGVSGAGEVKVDGREHALGAGK